MFRCLFPQMLCRIGQRHRAAIGSLRHPSRP
jgi:hypothetical protein